MKVLDIASGAGYGTAMLLRNGCEVIGADYNDDTVNAARNMWGYENFIKANALALPFDDSSFYAVISFETIEHVEDGMGFLSEMNRVLRPGGIFICSTPNIKYASHPAYHIKEYSPSAFYSLTEQVFSNVERYAQYFKIKDRIHDLLKWYVVKLPRTFSVSLMETFGIKETVKRFFRYNKRDLTNYSVKDSSLWSDIEKILDMECNEDYRVKSLKGLSWLRIMVIVARKEDS
jgi:2-polyprenyl-3-methyl-5-hydroxy-6-metoxy-1,4-benzoquinol methylase